MYTPTHPHNIPCTLTHTTHTHTHTVTHTPHTHIYTYFPHIVTHTRTLHTHLLYTTVTHTSHIYAHTYAQHTHTLPHRRTHTPHIYIYSATHSHTDTALKHFSPKHKTLPSRTDHPNRDMESTKQNRQLSWIKNNFSLKEKGLELGKDCRIGNTRRI